MVEGMTVPEAPLEQTGHGLVCTGDGWFVVNAEEVRWRAWPGLGFSSNFGGPCVVLAVGARGHAIRSGAGWGGYPVDAAALRHGVGVEEETDDPDVAYARFGETHTVPYGGWLD